MQLILFRHGIAEDRSADGEDFSRALTEEGIAKTRKAAQGLARIAGAVDVILTSPLVRAMQTAEIASRVLGADVQVLDALGGPDGAGIIAAVRRRGEQSVMIVGHNPTLEGIVESLVSGTGAGHRGTVQLKKAGAACFTIDSNHGVLLWLATAGMLRDIAG